MKLISMSPEHVQLVLGWRNNPLVYIRCRDANPIDYDTHVKWFNNSLSRDDRKIFIAYIGDTPVGQVRYDIDNGLYELSWTVDPQYWGRGYGKQMLKMFIATIDADTIAEIKKDNVASIKVAEYAGMKFSHEVNGMLYYKKPRN